MLDLITLDGSPPQCLGAITHHPKYGLQVIWARRDDPRDRRVRAGVP
ncbi:MAG: hypothetical protein R3C45_19210 [Phycisphaerales bacterium]